MKISEILNKEELTREDLLALMKIENKEELQLLFDKAYEIKLKYTHTKYQWVRPDPNLWVP